MKNVIYYLFFCFVSTVFSQNSIDDISGSYYIPSGNPEGGTNIVILPNKTFVVLYFGGMRKGRWEVNEANYTFTYHVEPKFFLYARNNSSVKDSVSIRYDMNAEKNAVTRYNATKNQPFTSIFNKDANCFEYPYVKKQKEALSFFEVCSLAGPDLGQGEVRNPIDLYRFKIKEDYNEFMLITLPSEYAEIRSFSATFINGTLVIDGAKEIEKRENYEDINEEDAAYIKRYTENDLLPKILEYGNEFFPNYDNPTEIDLLAFTRIESELSTIENIKILEKSLFTASCKD